MVSEESVDPTVEGSLPQESVAPDVEAAIPTISYEVTTPIAVAVEPEAPIAYSFVELIQPSSFLPLQKVTLGLDCSLSLFINDLLDLIIS